MAKQYSLYEVFCAVSSFWLVSIIMVFVNKHILDTSATKFNVLLFVSWFQCVCAVLLFVGVNWIARYLKKPALVAIDLRGMRVVANMSFVLLFMIVTNNLCLKNVSVAFYYISRSLSIMFTVLLTYAMLGRRFGWRTLFCCAFIFIGYGAGVFQESNVESILQPGIIWGVVSSFAAALYCVVMDKTVRVLERMYSQERERDPSTGLNDVRWTISLLTNLNVAIFGTPFVLFCGSPFEMLNTLSEQSSTFWIVLLGSGFLAIFVTYVSSWQIQVTSAMTHNVSGTAKNCVQTLLGCMIYNETKSMIWWLSNVLVAVGSLAYAWARQAEAAEEKSQAEKDAEAQAASQAQALEQVLVGSKLTSSIPSTEKTQPIS